MKLCVTIPALNEEKTISKVISGIPREIPGVDELCVLVINDGSTDSTEELARSAGADVVSNRAPSGLGAAFKIGVHEALLRGADIIVTIDGDGQFNSEDVSKLVKPITDGESDFVSCSRFRRRIMTPKMPFSKFLGNLGMAWFMRKLTGKNITDASCGFRAYSRDALLHLNLFGKFTYTQETLLDLIFKGFRYMEVPLSVRGQREFGKSRIASNLFKYAYQTLKIIFRSIRDYKPLRFIGGFGILLFLAGFACDVFLLIHFVKTGQFTPYKVIGFAGGFLNAMGVIIFVLGLVADMLDRIRMTNEKILYFEKARFYNRKTT